jgi:lysozyme
MTPSAYQTTRTAVMADEGFRPVAYDDATGEMIRPGYTLVGYPTIGYGTNVADPISLGLAAQMLDDKLQSRLAELMQAHPVVLSLDDVRQGVLANMAYNLGVPRLSGFTLMWAAIAVSDWAEAARQMLSSLWARQVGARAIRLAREMETGIA